MLPDLLEQLPPDQEIAAVTADGAYDTRRCHTMIAARGAAALVIVLDPMAHKARALRARLRSFGSQRQRAPPLGRIALHFACRAMIARNEAVRGCKDLGRAPWRKLTGYRRRRRAETKPLGIMRRIPLPVSG